MLVHILTFTNLASSTTYEIEITSTAYGCESEVFSSSFTTGIDCIVPENISLTATPFEVTLSWDALDGADSYFLVYKLPGTGWQTATVTDNFFTLSHDGNGLAYFMYDLFVVMMIFLHILRYIALSYHLVHQYL